MWHSLMNCMSAQLRRNTDMDLFWGRPICDYIRYLCMVVVVVISYLGGAVVERQTRDHLCRVAGNTV